MPWHAADLRNGRRPLNCGRRAVHWPQCGNRIWRRVKCSRLGLVCQVASQWASLGSHNFRTFTCQSSSSAAVRQPTKTSARNNFNFALRMNLNNYILSSEDHGSLLLTQLNPWNCSSLAECCIRAGGTLQLIVKLNVQNNFNFSFWTSFSSNNATWRIVL